MSSNRPIGSQPYTRPNLNYPQPGTVLYPNIPAFNPPPVPQMPRAYQPQPYVPPSMSYPGSVTRPTTSFPTYGSGQSTIAIAPPSGLSGPSVGIPGSSAPSFHPMSPSFHPAGVTPGITPSWVSSPSLPSHLSPAYTRINNTSGFSPPPLQPLDPSFLRYPTSMAVMPLPPSSFNSAPFPQQPPSLSGRAYAVSPVSSGSQAVVPYRNHELTLWTPNSISIERAPFIPINFGRGDGRSLLSQHQTRFSAVENHLDFQRSLRIQFEDAIKKMYQIHPSPERPFSNWQPMGMPVFAVQVNPQTTLFVDPVAVTEFFQRASATQQRAFLAQLAQIRPIKKPLAESAREIVSAPLHEMWKCIGILGRNTLLLIQEFNPSNSIGPKRGITLSAAWEMKAVPFVHEKIDQVFSTNIRVDFDPKKDGVVDQAVQNFFLNPLTVLGAATSAENVVSQSIKFGTRTEVPTILYRGANAEEIVISSRQFNAVEKMATFENVNNVARVGNYKYTETVSNHLNELVKRGPYAGELSRPYMQSPLVIEEIKAAGKPILDPGGIPGALRWDVPGTFRGADGTWELVLHPESGTIYHFNFK